MRTTNRAGLWAGALLLTAGAALAQAGKPERVTSVEGERRAVGGKVGP